MAIHSNGAGTTGLRLSSGMPAATLSACVFIRITSTVADFNDLFDLSGCIELTTTLSGTAFEVIPGNPTNPTSIVVGQWYFVGFANNGTTQFLYVKAVGAAACVRTLAAGTAGSAPSSITIGGGADQTGNSNPIADFACARLWSGAVLSQADFERESESLEPVRTADLFLDMRLDSTADLRDRTARGALFTNIGGLTTVAGPPIGAPSVRRSRFAPSAAAPTLTWFQSVQDLPAPGRAPASIDGAQVFDVLSVTTALSAPAWTGDAPTAVAARQPVADVPYVGNTLGWAPVRFIAWTQDASPPRQTSRSVDGSQVLDAVAASNAPAIFQQWVGDSPASRSSTSRATDAAQTLDALALSPLTFAGWNSDLGRPVPAPIASQPIPFVGTSLGWAPTLFVPWTTDTLRLRANAAPIIDTAHAFDAASLSLRNSAGWTIDLPATRPYARADVAVPFVGTTLGFAPVRFQQWVTDGPPAFRQPPGAIDTPYTGDTLGWAPVRFVTWTTDAAPIRVPPAALQSAYAPGPLGLLPLSWLPTAPDLAAASRSAASIDGSQVFDAVTPLTVRNFGSWSTDLPRGPKGPPPVESVAPIDATVPPTIGAFRSWPADVTPQRPNSPARDTPYVGAATTPAFVSAWRPWAADAPTPTRPSAVQDGAFVEASIGVPPRVSFVGWSADMQVHRPGTAALDGVFAGTSLSTAFASSWRAWSVDLQAAARKTAVVDGIAPLDDLAPPIFGFVNWTNDGAPVRLPSPLVDGPLPLFALASTAHGFAGWTTDIASHPQRAAFLDGASATGSLIRGVATYFGWTTEMSTGRRASPALPDSFVFDTHVNAVLFRFANWANDTKPLPTPTFPLSLFESWFYDGEFLVTPSPRFQPRVTPVTITVGAIRQSVVVLPSAISVGAIRQSAMVSPAVVSVGSIRQKADVEPKE